MDLPSAGLIVFRAGKNGPEYLLINDAYSPERASELAALAEEADFLRPNSGRPRDTKVPWMPLEGQRMGAETDLKCALREAYEVAGLREQDLHVDPAFLKEASYFSTRTRNVTYRLAQATETARIIPGSEGVHCQWFSFASALDRISRRNIQDVLRSAHEVAQTRGPLKPVDAPDQRPRRHQPAPHAQGSHPQGSHAQQQQQQFAAPLRSAEKSVGGPSGTSNADNPLYRTRLCERFEKLGECSYGPRCNYAHGEAELRRYPLSLSDAQVNPQYKTRLCERFMNDGMCQYGLNCTFAHGEAEMRSKGATPQAAPALSAVSAVTAKAPALVPASALVTPEANVSVTSGSAAGQVSGHVSGHSGQVSGHSGHVSGTFTSNSAPTVPSTAPSVPTVPTTAPTTSHARQSPILIQTNAKIPVMAHKKPAVRSRNSEEKTFSFNDLRAQMSDTDAPSESSAPPSPMLSAAGALEDSVAKDFAALFAENKGGQEEVRGVMRKEVQKNLTKQQLFNALIPAIVEAQADAVAALKKRISVLKQFMDNSADQIMVLRAFDRLFQLKPSSNVRPNILGVMKILYNQDIVEEDAITKWNAAAASNSLFKADIQPLVKWLQTAEEED